MKTYAAIFLMTCTSALADFTPLAPTIEPLPEADVGPLFERIHNSESIELATLYRALQGPQSTLRAYAAIELGKYGNETSIPYLIDALADESVHDGADYDMAGKATTRYWANESLKTLSRQDFGFVWDDSIDKRNDAIKRWRDWYQKEKSQTEQAGPGYPPQGVGSPDP